MFLAIFGRKKVSKKTVEIWAFESFGFNPNTSFQSFTIERFGFQVSRGGCWEGLKMPMSARTARIFARYGVCASLWWFLPHIELFFFCSRRFGCSKRTIRPKSAKRKSHFLWTLRSDFADFLRQARWVPCASFRVLRFASWRALRAFRVSEVRGKTVQFGHFEFPFPLLFPSSSSPPLPLFPPPSSFPLFPSLFSVARVLTGGSTPVLQGGLGYVRP